MLLVFSCLVMCVHREPLHLQDYSKMLYASRLLAVALLTELMAHAIDMFSLLFMSVHRKTPASSSLFKDVICIGVTRSRFGEVMLVALPTELTAHASGIFLFIYERSSGSSASSILFKDVICFEVTSFARRSTD